MPVRVVLDRYGAVARGNGGPFSVQTFLAEVRQTLIVYGSADEVATNREVSYVEEKGKTCGSHAHRRNHTIVSDRLATVTAIALASKAS